MLGYLGAHSRLTDSQLADDKADLRQFADQLGYSLGSVYVERIDRLPGAFGDLLEAIERDAPAAIGIPSVLHLAPLGFPPKLMHYLESITGVRVLVANAPP